MPAYRSISSRANFRTSESVRSDVNGGASFTEACTVSLDFEVEVDDEDCVDADAFFVFMFWVLMPFTVWAGAAGAFFVDSACVLALVVLGGAGC